jgi:hypothetical protein
MLLISITGRHVVWRFLTGHSVEEARSRGWEELSRRADRDRRASRFRCHGDHRQKYPVPAESKARKIALVVLEHSQWPMVKLVAEDIVAAVNAGEPGSYTEVAVPFKE